jgi:hypothetical protein
MGYPNNAYKTTKNRGGIGMKKVVALLVALCVFAVFSFVAGCKKAEEPQMPAAPAEEPAAPEQPAAPPAK